MPYLKDKIAKVTERKARELDQASEVKTEPSVSSSQGSFKAQKLPQASKNIPRKNSKPETSMSIQAKKTANSAKNIVKNFGRAMVTFAISKLAVPYLSERVKSLNLELKDFQQYLYQRKENMDGISSLRGLLLKEEDDDEQTVAIKAAFQYISEIFLKYFSVNWIYNSKLGDKSVHVKSRFKILRRIKDPLHFTYFRM